MRIEAETQTGFTITIEKARKGYYIKFGKFSQSQYSEKEIKAYLSGILNLLGNNNLR